jgi:hypothetical protein
MDLEEYVILDSEVDIENLGFTKAKDPISRLFKVLLIVFVVLLLFFITDAIFSKKII